MQKSFSGGEQSLASKAIPLVVPQPLSAAARERPSATNRPAEALVTPTLAAVSPPQTFLTPRNLFVVGVLFMLIALILLVVALRFYRQSPNPSFITRSFERDS